jgi:multiple sugar transport system substrate-binding protein
MHVQIGTWERKLLDEPGRGPGARQAEPGRPAASPHAAPRIGRNCAMRLSASRARITLAAALAAAVLVVAACGGGDSGGSGNANSGNIRGQTITYWASNQGATIDQDKQVLRDAIARFTQQTGVKVDFKVIPWSDLFTNITTAVTSGKGPDVLNIGNTWSATLQSTGAFEPFQGTTLSSVGGKDKFVQSSWSASGAPGKTPTSVPLYGLSYGLFYNKQLFKQAGIAAPPKTWSEFVADAKKLTNPAKGQYGVALEGASITENAHWAFILGRQNGGNLFDKDNKPTFDSPQNVKGVKDFVDLWGTDKVVNPSSAQWSDGTQALAAFAKGKAGMTLWQNNAENNIRTNGMKKSQYGVADVPVMDGTNTPIMTHVAGINISVFKNSQHKDAALAFVKFMTSPTEQVSLNQQFGSLPVTQAAQKDQAFDTPNLKTFNSILAKHAEPMPLINEEGQMETFVGDAVKQLVAKAATQGSVSEAEVKSALSAANQKMQAAGGGAG